MVLSGLVMKYVVDPRKVFFIVSALLFVCMMWVAPQVGITGDEPIDSANGKYSLAYYLHGDTTFVDYSKVPEVKIPHMKYYGVGFEILPALIVKYFGMEEHEYLIRHVLCAIFGFLFMLFAALTAKELKDWKLAIVTLLLMGLSPIVFGLSFLDSKDVPMAAGFAMAVYGFLRIYKKIPLFKWTDVILAIVGIALAVSIRVGGLLLPFYFAVGGIMLFFFRKDLRKSLLKRPYKSLGRIIGVAFGIVVVGVVLGCCAYPNFFYEGPVMHIKNAFKLVKEFKQQIPMLYEGEIISSLHLPDFYLLKSYLTTIPLITWAGIVLFVLQAKKVWMNYDRMAVLFILFTLLFPPLYITLGGSNIYNGWRHSLFIFSSFAAVAAIGFYETYYSLKNARLRKGFVLAAVIGAMPTACWMVNNSKYCYSYYNALIAQPYLNYDMDYYETSCQIGYDWLVKNVISESDTLVRVGAKNITVPNYQKVRKYKNAEVHLCSFRGFAEYDYDYIILSLQFIPVQVLKTFFPPRGTVHLEYIEGHPVCAVIKKENKFDSEGIRQLKMANIDGGMELLEKAYAYNPQNFGIWFWMGYGYYYQKEYRKAIEFWGKYLSFWPGSAEQNEIALVCAGRAFVELGMYDQAIQILKQAENTVRSENYRKFLITNLGIAYAQKKAYRQAIPYLEKAVQFSPELQGLLSECYKKLQK